MLDGVQPPPTRDQPTFLLLSSPPLLRSPRLSIAHSRDEGQGQWSLESRVRITDTQVYRLFCRVLSKLKVATVSAVRLLFPPSGGARAVTRGDSGCQSPPNLSPDSTPLKRPCANPANALCVSLL
ncbi:hypothetical protein AAFF_G00328720 [Aldrovandia affinis]|uniref:Uncharacterized protein n=1 Tax=Aldrovandia affinis TaxID=143900 RepID=A0AAD7WPS7_9TELE|nr:hypothetical protein AAFF_G00328720 [Aldrovandia affinis]